MKRNSAVVLGVGLFLGAGLCAPACTDDNKPDGSTARDSGNADGKKDAGSPDVSLGTGGAPGTGGKLGGAGGGGATGTGVADGGVGIDGAPPEGISVTLLGTGSPIPSLERFGNSTLVEAGGLRLLFDMGRGNAIRLWQKQISLGTINAHFLTHLHSDHVNGLDDLWLSGWIQTPFGSRKTPFVVYGPPGTISMMGNLWEAFSEDRRIRLADEGNPQSGIDVDAHDYAAGLVYDQNGVRVIAFEVNHGDLVKPAYGFTITYQGHKVVISGDTIYNENVKKEATGADLLVHEVAMIPQALFDKYPSYQAIYAHHISPEKAGELFAAAQPKQVVYSHVVLSGLPKEGIPYPTPADVLAATATTYAGPVVVGADLMAFKIDSTGVAIIAGGDSGNVDGKKDAGSPDVPLGTGGAAGTGGKLDGGGGGGATDTGVADGGVGIDGAPPEGISVTLLGTGSPIPSLERFGNSTLVEAGGLRLLFDMGRGNAVRLWQKQISLGTINTHFLTHLHSDHVNGLSDLWLSGWIQTPFGSRKTPFVVYGPPGTVSMMGYLWEAFSEDRRIRLADEGNPQSGIEVDAHDYAAGLVYDQNGVRVIAFEVNHGDLVKPAYGFTITYQGHKVVISGDTIYNENVKKEATGADLLVHEVAMIPQALFDKYPSYQAIYAHHISPEKAGELFAAAQPKQVVYSHVVLSGLPKEGIPYPTPADVLAATATTYAGPVVVGADLMAFKIDSTGVAVIQPPAK